MGDFENDLDDFTGEGLVENLKGLSEKYVQVAKDATSTKAASMALTVAERALAMLMKIQKENDEASGTIHTTFLSQVNAVLLRSQLWNMYVDYCEMRDMKPLRKCDFFDKLALMDFTVKRVSGQMKVYPPRKQIK